jgi:DNA-binding IclR family transcriptional regulator
MRKYYIPNPLIVKEIYDLHLKGLSLRKIAEKIKIPKSTLHRILREHEDIKWG